MLLLQNTGRFECRFAHRTADPRGKWVLRTIHLVFVFAILVSWLSVEVESLLIGSWELYIDLWCPKVS